MKALLENWNRDAVSRVVPIAALFFFAACGWVQPCDAQENPPSALGVPEQTVAPAPSPQNGNLADEVDSRPQHLSPYRPWATVHGTGRQSAEILSPLHWGHLNVLSFSFMQSYQTNTESSYDASMIKALVSYGIHKSGMDFVAEYTPALWLSQNGTSSNLADHAFQLATHRKAGRWVFGVAEAVYSVPIRSQYSEFGFNPYHGIGIGNINPALITGDVLSNDVSFTTERLLGPADRIQVGLRYLYYNVANAANTHALIHDSTEHSADGNLSWHHMLGWRSSVSVNYTYSQRYYTLESMNSDTRISHHHSVMTTYSLEPKPSWEFSIGFGPIIWYGPRQPYSKSYVTNALVKKKFNRSSITLRFNRSDEFVGIIGDTLGDQLDLSVDYSLGRKCRLITGGAYIRQVLDPVAGHGWRTWNQVSYALWRHASWFVSYSFFHQTELSPLNSLPSHFASTGIRWEWRPK